MKTGQIRQLQLFTLLAFGLASMPAQAVPQMHLLATNQTAIRNQQDRDTCWAFAGVAALEAAYKREYGLELDLSEQYVFHMGKASPLAADYATASRPTENNSSYWGHQGSWDILLKMQRFAVPLESDAPYLNRTQMSALLKATPAAGTLDIASPLTQQQLDAFEFAEGHIPTRARYSALYQVAEAEQLSDFSPEGVEQVLNDGHEVVGAFNLRWKKIPGSELREWDAQSTSPDVHVMLIVGYDRDHRQFWLKNSWGGKALEKVTYTFMRNALTGGAFIKSVKPPARQSAATWLGTWNLSVPGRQGQLVLRRFADFQNSENTPTKLGNLYEFGYGYDVEGYLDNDGNTLVFTVASALGHMRPGLMTGTVYRAQFNPLEPGRPYSQSVQMRRP